MYHAIVRRHARRAFDALSRGDYEAGLRGVAPDVHHVFAGSHAIGGERHGRDAMRRWFERLFRLFPKLEFEVRQVIVCGWPWNTSVAVEWRDRVTPAVGDPYVGEGTHVIRIRWGRAKYIHAYVDTQLVAQACERMAAQGVEEAAAAPITG